MSEKQKAFKITGRKGFHLTFPNGYTISTQFGSGNYCDNKDTLDWLPTKDVFSNTVELAIWNSRGEWVTRRAYKAITGKTPEDDVHGWVNITNWKKYLDWTASRRKVK